MFFRIVNKICCEVVKFDCKLYFKMPFYETQIKRQMKKIKKNCFFNNFYDVNLHTNF